MKTPSTTDVRKGISVLWETMQCPICLDLMTAPVSTKCDHQFCKFCMMKLLDSTKNNRTNCPVCKTKITKRSLQESPGFQRLVAGLQDMIKAYEHDTGTNYFTGMSQQKGQLGVTETETTEHCTELFGDTPDNVESVNNEDPSKSHSSTVAAQNGFAKLMGLDDTSPVMTEVEGLDSGLGEALPTLYKKISSPTDNLEPLETDISEVVETSTHKTRRKKRSRKLEKTSLPPSLIPNEPEDRPLRMSTRKKLQKDLKPDKVLEEKKKKSLEKVAEWLMKVPTEGSLELEKPNDDTEDSDSCSSASTIDLKRHISDVNPKREERAKALEEQVFGAVYKRERRGNKIAAPPIHVLIERPATKETLIISKTRRTNTVAPSGFVKETSSGDESESDMEEEHHRMDEEKDTSSDVVTKAKQTEVMEEKDEYGEELNDLPESDHVEDKVPCPVSDIGQVPGRRPNRRTCNTLQQVDKDLQAQAEAAKTENRKSKKNKTERGKSAKVQKPLVLVGVKNGETSPKARLRSDEVQVHIENYPSSEDQEIPTARRSRRLQLFAEEVQESHKKASRAEKYRNAPERSEEAGGGDGNVTPVTERNGCVFDQELEGIKDMESSETTPSSRPTEAVEEKAETASEANAAPDVDVVPSSSSPAGAALDTPLGNAGQDNPQLETVARVTKCAGTEDEEDKNDSELDTELLLKSFKATKRKSFFFGGPNVKKSRGSDTENPPLSSERTDRQDDDDSSWGDCISPSNSTAQTRKPVVEKPDGETLEASAPEGSCSGHGGAEANSASSSGLTPNKVSKQDAGEPTTYCQRTESQPGCSATDAGQGKEMREGPSAPSGTHSVCSAELLSRAEEGSLTPDGLGIPAGQIGRETTSRSGGAGSRSPAESAPRKRARRLESSLESGGSEEDLPTLTEIFRTSARGESEEAEGCAGAPAGGRRRLSSSSSSSRRPPECPSGDELNSSQASVDLFGTPDQCNVPANDAGVASQFESSQFSSEVLVTQQKIEMQKELVRLEKLMALVSEVLQEKEDSPAKDVPSETNPSGENPDAHRLLPHDQHPGRGSDREASPEAEREPGRRRQRSVRGAADTTAVQRSRPAGPGPNGTMAPCSSSASKTLRKAASPSPGQEDKENNTPPRDRSGTKMLLVSSGLGPNEQTMVKRFARRVGARVVSTVTPEVTHVIMHTDEHLVCERTLKYFLGIAGRKWVVGFQWISECFRQKELLDESTFEVRGDVVNGPDHHGPMRARTREDNNLLMKGYKICFQGPFTDMTTDEMESMVELCGAAVVREPRLLGGNEISHQLVIVQSGSESSPTRSSRPGNATVVTRGWLLDSVATYTLQNYDRYAAPAAGVHVTTAAS